MCARHIYANLKKKFPHRADMKGLFWKLAKSYNSAQYEKNLERLRQYDMGVYELVMKKNPTNCSLAFMKPTSGCDAVSNNISESFNHAINPERELPLVEMLETIRRRSMFRMDARKKKANRHQGKYSIAAMKRLELEQEKIGRCKAWPAGPGEYEVKEKNSAYVLHMGMHSCTCRKWDMSGIPCRHALKVISVKKLNQEDYISRWYLTSRWRNEYNAYIDGLTGVNFWKRSGETELLPPPVEVRTGRGRVGKRIRERNESPTKKRSKGVTRVSREKRIMHCGRCSLPGHNMRKCPNHGAPKMSKGTTTDDGSTQPTQSQVID